MSISKLVIVGPNDNPVYEADFVVQKDPGYFVQFIAHSSLDLIEEVKWKTRDMYLKKVDSFSKYTIYSWVTATNTKFIALIEKQDATDSCKSFFSDIYELYLKILLNPFYSQSTPIKSKLFDTKVRKLAQKYSN